MSASAIGWIITAAFVLILIIGFFIGFWRGLKRSVVNLICSIAGLILSFFITPVIARAILNINISIDGQPMTISDALVDSLKSNEDIALMIDNNPNLERFFSSLPGAIANIVVFILLAIAVELVIYIIYKVLALTCVKYKDGAKKLRLFGGGVGLVKAFIFSIFVFMPLASLIGTTDYLTQDRQYFQISQEQTDANSSPDHLIDSVLPSSAETIIDGLDNNLLIKICNASGLSDSMFDYLTKVEIDGKDVTIRSEIKNGYVLADYGYQLANYYDASGLVNFKNTDFDLIEKSYNRLVEGGLFDKIIASTLANIVQNYNDYSFITSIEGFDKVKPVIDDIGATLNSIESSSEKSEYFSSDLQEVFAIFKEFSLSGMLDEIASSEDPDFVEILTRQSNRSSLSEILDGVFNLNILQDSAVSAINLVIDETGFEIDKIGVDTSVWTDQDWDEIENSILDVINYYDDLSGEIDVLDVINDISLLVGQDSQANLETVTKNLGLLIDEIRGIKLLKNSQGQPIVDKLLTDNNFALPSNPLIDNNGQSQEITNYSQLFAFVLPSLQSIKESNLYSLLTSDTTSTTEIVAEIADKIEQNETLLEDIILPLYQIDLTKDLITDNLINVVDASVMDLSMLNSYDAWKSELPHISSVLVNLNKTTTSSGQTYLEVALGGDINSLVDSLTSADVDNILKPILYANVTSTLKDNIASEMESVINEILSPSSTSISFENITLVQGNAEDQADEICNVFKSFIQINETYQSGMTITDIDKISLGLFMDSLQKNAYRVELYQKSEQGIFHDTFISLTNAIKDGYAEQIARSEELTQLFNDPANYIQINFPYVFSLLAQLA